MKRKRNTTPLTLRDLNERKEDRMESRKVLKYILCVLGFTIAFVLFVTVVGLVLDNYSTPDEWYRGLNPEMYEEYDAQRYDY